jgi:hypothetical protein
MANIQQIENEEFERNYCPADRFAGFDRGDGPNEAAEYWAAQNEEWTEELAAAERA